MNELPSVFERWVFETYRRKNKETPIDLSKRRQNARRIIKDILYNTDPESPVRRLINEAKEIIQMADDACIAGSTANKYATLLSISRDFGEALRDLGEDV